MVETMFNHHQPTSITASSGSRRPESTLHLWNLAASAFCHLELSWMLAGMARQSWMWMRIWRDDWHEWAGYWVCDGQVEETQRLGRSCGGDTGEWSEVVQVAGDEKGRYDRWDSEWRIGVRE
jgi:hypothetical protein